MRSIDNRLFRNAAITLSSATARWAPFMTFGASNLEGVGPAIVGGFCEHVSSMPCKAWSVATSGSAASPRSPDSSTRNQGPDCLCRTAARSGASVATHVECTTAFPATDGPRRSDPKCPSLATCGESHIRPGTTIYSLADVYCAQPDRRLGAPFCQDLRKLGIGR